MEQRVPTDAEGAVQGSQAVLTNEWRLPRSMGSSRLKLVFVQACELALLQELPCIFSRQHLKACSSHSCFSGALCCWIFPFLSIKVQGTSPAQCPTAGCARWWGTERPCCSPAPHGLIGNARRGYSVVKREYLHNVYLPLIARNKFHKCFMCLFQSFWLELFTKGL